jgi:hypothetical protein
VRLSCSAPSATCAAMPIEMRASSSDNGSSRGIKRNRHRKSLSLLWRQGGSRKIQVLGVPTSQKPKLWAIHPFRKGMEPPTGMAPPTSEPRRMGLLAPICLPHYVVHRVGATPRLLRTAPTEACQKPLVFRLGGVSLELMSATLNVLTSEWKCALCCSWFIPRCLIPGGILVLLQVPKPFSVWS